MTEHGTTRLSELRYFPCSCPACRENDPESMLEMDKIERQRTLAEHNLYVSFSEIKLTKQAIVEERLWEHLELRAHGHPSLLQALKSLGKYAEYLETQSPVTKRSGLFFLSPLGLARPEIIRHRKRLSERYSSAKAKVLVLLPQTRTKPFHRSNEYQKALKEVRRKLGDRNDFHICIYAAPFGIVPMELDEVYPLSQYEIAAQLDLETIDYVAKEVADYLMAADYERAVLVQDVETWKGRMAAACRWACKKKGTPLMVLEGEKA